MVIKLVRKKNKTLGIGILAFLLLGSLVFIAGDQFDWWTAESVSTETDIYIDVYDEYSHLVVDDDDHQIYPYYCDTTSMTGTEKLAITWSDYTAGTSFNGGEDFEPKDNYFYKFLINGTDYVDAWVSMEDSISYGHTSVYLMNETEDVAIGLMSTDELDANFDNTVLDKWTVYTQTLNGAEATGLATEKEGYKAFYDESTELWNTVVLRVGFNTTAVASYVALTDDLVYNTVVTGNYVYFEMRTTLMGADTFHFTLGAAALNTTVAAEDVAIGYGSGASSTLWDTYSL